MDPGLNESRSRGIKPDTAQAIGGGGKATVHKDRIRKHAKSIPIQLPWASGWEHCEYTTVCMFKFNIVSILSEIGFVEIHDMSSYIYCRICVTAHFL